MSFEGIHNEKQVLQQIAGGDRDAFRLLYTTYFPHVQKYVSLFEPSKRNLDELTQDVFIRIWEKKKRLEGVESFRPYLFLITRNVVFNFIRAMKVQQQIKDLDDSAEIGNNDMENELLFRQYYRIAMEAMEKLPPGRRKVLKMSIDEGLSLDEIAAELNITRAGVKKQLYAATAYVRQYLQEHGEMTVLLFVFLSLFFMDEVSFL